MLSNVAAVEVSIRPKLFKIGILSKRLSILNGLIEGNAWSKEESRDFPHPQTPSISKVLELKEGEVIEFIELNCISRWYGSYKNKELL